MKEICFKCSVLDISYEQFFKYELSDIENISQQNKFYYGKLSNRKSRETWKVVQSGDDPHPLTLTWDFFELTP